MFERIKKRLDDEIVNRRKSGALVAMLLIHRRALQGMKVREICEKLGLKKESASEVRKIFAAWEILGEEGYVIKRKQF